MPGAFPWALGMGWDYTKLGIKDLLQTCIFLGGEPRGWAGLLD